MSDLADFERNTLNDAGLSRLSFAAGGDDQFGEGVAERTRHDGGPVVPEPADAENVGAIVAAQVADADEDEAFLRIRSRGRLVRRDDWRLRVCRDNRSGGGVVIAGPDAPDDRDQGEREGSAGKKFWCGLPGCGGNRGAVGGDLRGRGESCRWRFGGGLGFRSFERGRWRSWRTDGRPRGDLGRMTAGPRTGAPGRFR